MSNLQDDSYDGGYQSSSQIYQGGYQSSPTPTPAYPPTFPHTYVSLDQAHSQAQNPPQSPAPPTAFGGALYPPELSQDDHKRQYTIALLVLFILTLFSLIGGWEWSSFFLLPLPPAVFIFSSRFHYNAFNHSVLPLWLPSILNYLSLALSLSVLGYITFLQYLELHPIPTPLDAVTVYRWVIALYSFCAIFSSMVVFIGVGYLIAYQRVLWTAQQPSVVILQ
eukprot:TRINITY_DN18921_c0_g1_i1.p1 TRINITY_DN18921_c0_g1~~TRINITY_DN18921_c0_g1_i1.p1  ORF type:complete len:231 (-),score=54.61 TRINITY_DN18921_c0_g1_i1:46-711(-)